MAGTRLFVGNLPYATTEQDLHDLFANTGGAVKSVRVITDYETGRSKGYAFVEMETPETAAQAIQKLNGHALGGRSMVVNEARPRESGGRGGRG